MLLGTLLVAMIKPYYRNNQIKTIETIVTKVEDNLINKTVTQRDVEDTSRLIFGSNVCTLIYNEKGETVYEKNALGEVCIFNDSIELNDKAIIIDRNPNEVIEILKGEDINKELTSKLSGSNVLLYGKKIQSNLANYYLLINTPLEPIESYIDFILNQYLYMGLLILIISIVIAFYLAKKISSPIVKMKQEANKLASGDYKVKFESNSYSEINDLANTLDDATNKLSKVDELRKDLVANVSHDIKTPLTVIKSYAEMIKDISGDDPIKRNEHLDVILSETEYLSKLIIDMQEYSKMQAGYIELNKANFDMADCINSDIILLKTLIEDKNIQLKTCLKSVVVFADEMKMSQVIYNFLTNAIKHSSENTKVEVKMIDNPDFLRVEVKDYGDGISKEALPYIWDRYYKIDKGFSRSTNSTGLGLAIAKAILEAHKARFGVESKLGEGSLFYFELDKDYDDE